MPLCISAGVAGLGSIGSGLLGANAAEGAAKTQAQAAEYAANLQKEMFDITRQGLSPWMTGGQEALQQLLALTGAAPGTNPETAQLTTPFNPTMAQLSKTPGYRFALQQGELATNSQYGASGLHESGAEAKGVTSFAQGLASTTYQQQFQNHLSQNEQVYNMLSGISGQGENAAAMTGTAAQQFGLNAGQFITQGANASAAGQIGVANALSGGLNGLGNLGLLFGMYGQGGDTGGGIAGGGGGWTSLPGY